jgi:PKD repeat protein
MAIGRTLLPIASGGGEADFTASVTTIEPSDTVTFTDQTTDITPTSWEWDFGDGETSTLQNPSHRYKFSGQFTVTLIASDGVDTVFKQEVAYIDCQSVSCIFTIDTRRADNTTNNDQFRYVRPAVGGSTDIDWGDGNTDTITGANTGITHTYATPGIYKVKFDSTTFGIPSQITRDKIIEFNNWGSGVTYWQGNNLLLGAVCDMYANDTVSNYPSIASVFSNHAGFISEDIFKNWPTIQMGGAVSNVFVGGVSWDGDISKIVLDNGAASAAGNLFRMFESNRTFNQDLSHWFTSSPVAGNDVRFHLMFQGCKLFNQDIGMWDVSAGTLFNEMFNGASNFNQDISSWDVSNSTTFGSMFRSAISFNQDISSWNVINSTSMGSMFFDASSFNQNLGAWQLRTASVFLAQIFRNSGMSTENYTDTIVGWANYVFDNGGPINVNMTLQTGMVFTNSRSGGANFADAGAARTYLVGQGWSITGDTVV